MANAKIKVTYVSSKEPVKQAKVENSAGYFDLIVNKSKNGKVIRISDKFGENRVNVTVDSIDALIEALKLINTQGVAASVDEIAFDRKRA